MTTVDKEFADKVIAANGVLYPDERAHGIGIVDGEAYP